MIYKKSANFPYPLLTNDSNAYEDCEFLLDINLMENSNNYRFGIEYKIKSKFINKLLENGQARLVLVIQSRDNKFYYVELNEKYKDIPKSRISLSKKTKVQMSVQVNETITFKDNDDLSEFYKDFKNDIVIQKHSILGFSNVVIFDGSQKKPFELFEKRIDPNLKSNIKIELGNETIIIIYKNEKLQFSDSSLSGTLNNPYVYMGLQKSLYKFIDNYKGDYDSVDLMDIDEPIEPLNMKLYNLMKSKFIEELNYENVDEVIELISDGILEKYNNAIREIMNDRG